MRETAILRALTELDRWRRRREEILADAGFLRRRDPTVRAELAKVDRQVAYYEALTRDMKREVKPAGLSDLLRTLVKL